MADTMASLFATDSFRDLQELNGEIGMLRPISSAIDLDTLCAEVCILGPGTAGAVVNQRLNAL